VGRPRGPGPLHRPPELRPRPQRPGVPRRGRPQLLHPRRLPAHPGPDRDRRRTAAQPAHPRTGCAAAPHLRAVRARRGHRGPLVEAPPPADGRRERPARVARPRRPPAELARRPRDRPVDDVLHPDVEVRRVRHPAHARRPPGRARGTRRGRVDRRRELVAGPAAHHDPAARPDHPDLGVPVDHRLAPALRHGVGHHARRSPQRHADHGHVHGREGPVRRPARLRQRHRRDPVPDLARHRARVPALRPAPRPRRRRHPRGSLS